MVSLGQFSGWASPSLPILIQNRDADYPVHLTSDEGSWVAALTALGATLGAVTTAFVVNTIGRKNTMLVAAVPSVISWLLIAFATSPRMLYVARFICGLAVGIGYLATPMYLGEISPPKIRGILISMLTVAAKIGTTLEYAIGPFLSVKNHSFVSLTVPCLFIITFIWVPESPYHLMRRDAKQKAIRSLVQLRGKNDVQQEADTIERSVKVDLANEAGFRDLLFVPGNRRALIVILCLAIFQQMSGSQAALQYAETIFDEANSTLEGKYLTMILGAVGVVCTIICMFVTDYCGRKLLLIISSIGASCSTAMVAAFFTLQHHHIDTSKIVWLPAIGVFMYIVTYALGLAGLIYTMAGELFPTNVKALGVMMGVMMSNVVAFIVTKLYAVIAESIGTHVPFWIFTVCSFVSALFTFFYIPETKGKTLEQIQEKLHMPRKQ